MSIIDKLRPTFWNYEDVAAGSHSDLYSFRRKWWRVVILTTIVALTPLILLSVFDYRLTKNEMKTEAIAHTNQMLSGVWRSVSFFLAEHRSALTFVLNDNDKEALLNPKRLQTLLDNLNDSIGGFVDLTLISSKGNMQRHAGRFPTPQDDFCEDLCFKEVVQRGFYIGDLVSNQQPEKYLAMAIRKDLPNNDFFVLRATLELLPIAERLTQEEEGPGGDTFIVSDDGILQTPSRFYGAPNQKIPMTFPKTMPVSSTAPQVFETVDQTGTSLIVGFAPIVDTSLVVVVAYQERELMARWRQSRVKMFLFLGVSIAAILLMVLGMATYLVNRIHAADQKRIMELHKVEYANKMASLGRLSAGVGHEINNPIAIVNEKIGLIKDLLLQIEDNPFEQKMTTLADDITQSIKRCGEITNRLINFGRYEELRFVPLDLKDILHDLLAFMEKEAESLCVLVSIDAPEDLPMIQSDKNSLQQIFLNIINNAFAAMEDGGRLDIRVELKTDALKTINTQSDEPEQSISIAFIDSGRGIAPEDLKRVFEPFFSSKSEAAGTGLGLSVTYGLVKQIGGKIDVDSEPGKGTRFIVDLPLAVKNGNPKNECLYYPTDEVGGESSMGQK